LIESTEVPKSTIICLASAERRCPDGILSPSAWGNVVGKYELCHKHTALLTWWKREPIVDVVVPGGTVNSIPILVPSHF